MSTLEHWPKVKRVLEGALARTDAELPAYLEETCGTDAALRAQVEHLLAARDRARTFLETPAAMLLAPRAVPEDLSGCAIGAYQVVSRLGSGGMGDVYLGHDSRLDRPVAIKFLSPELAVDRSRLRRFHQEAKAASSVNHPHIVVVHDFGELDGRPYIVTEFIEGETLRQRLANGPLPIGDVVDLGVQMASALAAAHAQDVVHRDVKPENVMVRPDGYLKVLDFGLAKLATRQGSPDPVDQDLRTRSGTVMGTPSYMSPEQARGLELDARSDVWSLGVVLYEMATGQLPFTDSRTATVSDRERSDGGASEDAHRRVPTELLAIIRTALETVRDQRYQSAADLCAALKHLQRAPDSRRVPLASEPGGVPRPAVSLAVLPFRDVSGETSSHVWGIGIADAIIGRLASLKNLAVRPTSSVLKYATAPAEIADIARELQVDAVLDGTFSRTGDRIRVSVQLVTAEARATQWANRYDLSANDVFTFQDDVAQQVLEGLRVHVSGAERASIGVPITRSAEAYDLYLQARFHWTEYSVRSMLSSLRHSRHLLERAISIDADFVQAHALLAFVLAIEVANNPVDSGELLDRAQESAHNALRLDPHVADAWIALGTAQTQAGRNVEAIRSLRRALTIAPHSEFALDMLAYAYHYAGLVEQAEEAASRARSLDPTSRRLRWLHGRILLYLGRIPEAIALMDFARTSDHSKALAHLGKFLYYGGRLDEAERAFARALERWQEGNDPSVPILAAYLFASRGERHRISPTVLAYTPSTIFDGDIAYWVSGIHALLGDRHAALAFLRRAVALGNHNYPWFSRDPNYDGLRGDAAYEEILAEVRAAWTRYRTLFGDRPAGSDNDSSGVPGPPRSVAPAPREQTIKYCTTRDGMRIAYASIGRGPLIVRVLGHFTHLEVEWEWPDMRRFWDELAERHTVVRYDGRGIGLSDRYTGDFTEETRQLDLEAVLDAIGAEKAVLLGISEGGWTAAMYAVRQPQRITHLILYGAYVRGAQARPGFDAEEDQALVTLIRKGWGRDTSAFRQVFTSRYFRPDADPGLIAHFNNLQRVSADPDTAARYYQSSHRRGDGQDLYRQLRVQTLVVHSQNDFAVSAEEGRLLASIIPGAQLVLLPSSAHYFPTDTEVVTRAARAIARFLQTVG
jgi:serine/threonine protein kinase/pimeloyl-ACP methyl ester carboxylesterase/tetratricopeptide (TPR) repeat protein